MKKRGECSKFTSDMALLREMVDLTALQVNADECDADWAQGSNGGFVEVSGQLEISTGSTQGRKCTGPENLGELEEQWNMCAWKTSPRMCSTHLLMQKGSEPWREFL